MTESGYSVTPLAPAHDRTSFACGKPELDRYFREQAGQDVRRRIAAVYVMVETQTAAIAGYFTLSSTVIELNELPGELARRLPRYPEIPAILIGRLALDERFHGQGLGGVLLAEALGLSLNLSTQLGAYAAVVDALDSEAYRFYERYGFRSLTGHSDRLFLPMASIRSVSQ